MPEASSPSTGNVESRNGARSYKLDEIVSEWRKTLIPLLNAKPETSVGGSASKYAFMDHESYASLRPHLKPELVRKLEGSTIQVVLGGPPFPRNEIMEEIARIEREWQLI